ELKKISRTNNNFEWIFTDRQSFNISDLENVNVNLNKYNPNIFINCAAYTSVDNAEDDFQTANIINHKAVSLIAKWCNVNNCKLIHISTDYVYDGNSLLPYIEADETNSLNNYGKSKLLGDLVCQKYNPSSIIIRTAWLYSSFGNNFVKQMINLMKSKNELNVINDQFGSPTFAADLAEVILRIINIKIWKPGIYHYTNLGNVSWFDFANDIKSIFGFDVSIVAVSTSEYFQKAKRPKYSLLDNSKIKNTFDINQMNYLDSLNKCIKILQNES
ncbi:MAG: dTDP-4-dehydrorhamnose reductase, partial [Flavobacteriaceae bacterium]|nr:dTDP-4-dehydrorhamnose reductase [Flavobacteriaceae bacterium]